MVNRWLKVLLILVGVVAVLAFAALAFVTRGQGQELVHHPVGERRPLQEIPADYGLPFEDVTVTTEDGLHLAGWYVPSQNGAAIMAQHGFKGDRTDLLVTAQLLQRHGYGVLLTSIRAHDRSEGDLITFGKHEMKDLEAWYQYLLSRDDVEPDRIGILGESMGGTLCLQYAAQNENIHAVVAHSAFPSLDETVEISVQYYTGLPAFPFAPMIVFWAEREAGIKTSDVDAKKSIAQISPRPVFILQGGADDHVPTQSGQWLYEAAGGPKELWYEPEATHHGFDEEPFVAKFEQRVVAFFDQYLLGR